MVIFDLEHLEDVNEGNLIVGGGFQLVTGGTSATTGAAAGGRIINFTSSIFTLNSGLPDPSTFSVFVNAVASSTSFPF